MRVLCLDIEGGYGGSSRSLFESVRHMPDGIEVEVWCRREGPVQERYEKLGVSCRVTPEMPHISSLPRLSRNLYAFCRFWMCWSKTKEFRKSLASAARDRFDVVHFNHEGLFLLARWLRSELGASGRMTAHVRTHLPSTRFSRWQYRVLANSVDRLVFITEMEQENVARLVGRPVGGSVIYNITEPGGETVPDPALAADTRFKVVSASNFAWVRGTDRLIDIAAALKSLGRRDILFVVAGRVDLPKRLPGALGRIAGQGGTLADYAKERGVGDMFRFLGHVADPAPILTACDLLARPSRGNDPWGREVLEAMAAGLPVLATGEFDRFVEDGVTGILHGEFDAGAMASAILDMADSPAERGLMAEQARKRVDALCGGENRAADLARLWREIGK